MKGLSASSLTRVASQRPGTQPLSLDVLPNTMHMRQLYTWQTLSNFWAISELCFVIADVVVVIVLHFHVVRPSGPLPLKASHLSLLYMTTLS